VQCNARPSAGRDLQNPSAIAAQTVISVKGSTYSYLTNYSRAAQVVCLFSHLAFEAIPQPMVYTNPFAKVAR
jgi:hypothetical protein